MSLTVAMREVGFDDDGDGLESANAEYYTLAPTPLSFRSTAPLTEFQEVQINGETVDPSNYTLTEGSTIVTFPIDYLKTLENGEYEVTIVSETQSPKGNFSVVTPGLNEFGFYYNQPYTAYVEAFGGNTTFFMRPDGTMDCMVNGAITETATYEQSNRSIVVNSMAGTFEGTVSEDGTEMNCSALAAVFRLGDESIVADEEYIYIYDEGLDAYGAMAIDKSKSHYGPMKLGINGKQLWIANSAFYGCSNLVAITIQEGTIEIGREAFHSCTSLTNVSIPNSVRSIGNGAFTNCDNLISVAIPEGVKTLGSGVFQECDNLTTVILPSELDTISNAAFFKCINLENVVITAVNIHSSAFSNCDSLSEITISEQLSMIESFAFANCSNLRSIIFEGTTSQWNNIVIKRDDWNYNVPATYVQCSDGTVAL